MDSWSMSWWIWVLLGFVLLLFELITPGGLYMLFFGLAAIVVGLLGAGGMAGPPWMQWLLFSIISVAALLFFRKPLLRKLRVPNVSGDVDSVVGETAVALSDIAVDEIGKAELRGTAWNARNIGSKAVTRGQRCKVENIDGLMLWIRC